MKRTLLQRKTTLTAKKPLRKPLRSSKRPLRATKVAKGIKPRKKKLPTVKSMRNKCDALLTPIIKKMNPHCIFTGEETQVAHHAIKKSTSSALRYYIPNLVPLTHKSHMRLHSDEILWTGRLIAIKGLDWWQDLEEKKNEYVKCDVHHYIEEYARLKKLHDSL